MPHNKKRADRLTRSNPNRPMREVKEKAAPLVPPLASLFTYKKSDLPEGISEMKRWRFIKMVNKNYRESGYDNKELPSRRQRLRKQGTTYSDLFAYMDDPDVAENMMGMKEEPASPESE